MRSPCRPIAIHLAVLLLALAGCRAVPVAPTANDAAAGGPPTGQVPWLTPPGPGWVLIVSEAANSTVMLYEPSLRREGERSTALILINHVQPVQRLAGRWVRSEVSGIEADCGGQTYRLAGRRLHPGHGGSGEPLAAVPAEAAGPMRPAQPGSLAEDVVAALCARARPEEAPASGGGGASRPGGAG